MIRACLSSNWATEKFRQGGHIPCHPLAQVPLQNLAFPLAAPSANKFGRVSPVRVQPVADQLGREVSYIPEGGTRALRLESTRVDLSTDRPQILHLGVLAVEHQVDVILA